MKIVSENRFSGKTYFYTIGSRLSNLSSENIWFEKSAVGGAECAHFSKLAKENRATVAVGGSGENNKSTSKGGKTDQSISSDKTGMLRRDEAKTEVQS